MAGSAYLFSGVGTYVRMTSQGNPWSRFQRALTTGNVTLVRAVAAELPRIGVAEAAAMLLVIEQAEPERYERAARRRHCPRRTGRTRRGCFTRTTSRSWRRSRIPRAGS